MTPDMHNNSSMSDDAGHAHNSSMSGNAGHIQTSAACPA